MKRSAFDLPSYSPFSHLPRVAIFMAALTLTLPLAADDEKSSNTKNEKGDKAENKEENETKSATEAEISINGQKVVYTATAGTLPLNKADGEKRASVFYIAYERKGTDAKRPVTFCFNGGPGSSSVWLHLGAFGPKRVDIPGTGVGWPKPPFNLVANEHSLLDVTDLVFIDPVSTGFSRAEKPDDARQFHGYTEDLESVGEFIQRYISRNNRWASPKFLAGESYGGLRAAGLAGHLQQRYGMYLNGIAIVSGVIDFTTLSSDPGNDVSYITFLSSMSATAHYHKKLAPDLLQKNVRDVMAEAAAFAQGEYASALLSGHALPAEKTTAIALQLARLTGIPSDLWVRERLRISPSQFRRKLLETENQVVGRFDGRVVSDASAQGDPSYDNVYGAFSSTLNAYVRGELKYESDLAYEILTRDVHPWSYANFAGRYVSSSEELGNALNANPDLRVFVACGHYDLATPGGGIEHSINHLPVAPARLNNVTYGYYEGGHMMYSNLDSLSRLNADMRTWLTQ